MGELCKKCGTWIALGSVCGCLVIEIRDRREWKERIGHLHGQSYFVPQSGTSVSNAMNTDISTPAPLPPNSYSPEITSGPLLDGPYGRLRSGG